MHGSMDIKYKSSRYNIKYEYVGKILKILVRIQTENKVLLKQTFILTPWSGVFCEKLTGSQLVKITPRILRNSKVHYSI
jgi:hypothetical protein